MENNNKLKIKTKKFIILYILVIIIFVLFIGLFFGGNIGVVDYYTDEDLGNEYFYTEEKKIPIIWNNNFGSIIIDGYVFKIAHNSDYILAFQWNGHPTIDENKIYSYEELLEKFKTENKPFFWIIDKRDNQLYGPMNMSEYLFKKNELKIPNTLKLDLKLKI